MPDIELDVVLMSPVARRDIAALVAVVKTADVRRSVVSAGG
ncbi:hypothetical protein M3J09_009398 [Ascochyta lentis]